MSFTETGDRGINGEDRAENEKSKSNSFRDLLLGQNLEV